MWNPDQYQRFAAERAQPFWDLLALVSPVAGATVVDLGCGTGELTGALHRHTAAAATVGVDNSAEMLAKAVPEPGLRFELGDIATFAEAPLDVVFSNAALHWVPDHERLLPRLASLLGPGGQLAVQVPANFDHPSHTVAAEVASEFGAVLAERPPVLAPERYAEVLDGAGFAQQHVRLQVYAHHLASTADVVEWTKGTALIRFQPLIPPDAFDEFVERYRRRLLDVLGDRSPYLYPFKRILMWARFDSTETEAR